MPQYMLAVHHSPTTPQPTPENMQQAFEQVSAFNDKVTDAGAWVFGGGLESPEIATVVSAEGAEKVITDGPFAESKEHLGGFWVIEASDLDAALDWATEASAACMGPVEVRPFQAEPPA
jgi:hypothetical protein